MESTTISISKETRDKIKEFGLKGETYTDILERLYASARERLLHDLFFNNANAIPIDQAIAESKKRWQK